MAQPGGAPGKGSAADGAGGGADDNAAAGAATAAGGSGRARHRPVATVRDRYSGSLAQDFGRRLSGLDVANQATLLGAGLLASLLPFLILLSAFANERVDDDIALRLGLDRRAETIVTGLFHSSPASLSVATVTSLVFVAAGSVAVAGALQQVYEKVFRLPHRRKQNLPRLLIWVAALCATIAVESIVGRPARNAWGGGGLVQLVSFAVFTPFFWWTMHFLLAGRVGWRRLFPSAVATGGLMVALGVFSELYFSATIVTDSRTFGAIGAVFSLLTWLIAIGVVVILGPLAGAVWRERRSRPPDPLPLRSAPTDPTEQPGGDPNSRPPTG